MKNYSSNAANHQSHDGVDRTLLRENLKLSVTERFRKHKKIAQFVEKLRSAGKNARGKR
jgi:hypothetical protein